MIKPAAYIIDSTNTQLWVMDDNVCIFERLHAEIIFAPGHHYDGLKVWAIKNGKAECVMDVMQAIRFFEEN